MLFDLCVEEKSGQIIAIDEDGEIDFWNSSIKTFSESLSAFESAFGGFRIYPTEHDYSKHADVFINKLLEIDRKAVENWTGWINIIHFCQNNYKP